MTTLSPQHTRSLRAALTASRMRFPVALASACRGAFKAAHQSIFTSGITAMNQVLSFPAPAREIRDEAGKVVLMGKGSDAPEYGERARQHHRDFMEDMGYCIGFVALTVIAAVSGYWLGAFALLCAAIYCGISADTHLDRRDEAVFEKGFWKGHFVRGTSE